ncbi:hypothetical protein [uncultured Roseobacter sp.]|uniref:hypothetical protein n=1 Tax=uncultured Roseobacter sp. TaxID=114847 RepID=UPI00261DEA92|nr:hypothetical protein [uncultured Roseobacter sp.]
MTSFEYTNRLAKPRLGLGPAGPFPDTPLNDPIDRRWLHYAFLSRDGKKALVANSSWLGPGENEPPGTERFATILLLHDGDGPWHSSQFNARTERPPWSAFSRPHAHRAPQSLTITSANGSPAVALELQRTSRNCTSQCAFFANHQHLRWQSETGVLAKGTWTTDTEQSVDLVGYHERVRGRWGWPDLGEWVFGFANDLGADPDEPPEWACVFTFIRPEADCREATASMMLWHRGRMIRHFPRRNVSFAVRGELDRDRISTAPPLATLLGTGAMSPIPRRLAIIARQGDDHVVLDFDADWAVRIVIPSETSLHPFSVHEVVGACLLEGSVNGRRFAVETRGIVEFSGGAHVD